MFVGCPMSATKVVSLGRPKGRPYTQHVLGVTSNVCARLGGGGTRYLAAMLL